jgi:nucleotide-binding universal stress UspA family protein
MQPKRILCPIDFSEGSRAAMRDAVELARPRSAAITLLYVFRPPVTAVNATSDMLIGEAVGPAEGEARRELDTWREDALALGATQVETALAPGIPWDQIVRQAEKEHVQLIVMGTHGRTGLHRALVGSVAEKVVRHATCSVLVVREPR